MLYTPRTLALHLDRVTSTFPVLLVTGPRQVGKTTLLQHAREKTRTYVTLDDPASRTLAKEDPGLFLKRYQSPVLIDEIQYAPELLPLIKIEVDNQHKPGLFWLTGSQQFHLMQNVAESLAGRVGILKLQGLSQAEKHEQPDREPFLPAPDYFRHCAPASGMTLRAIFHTIWRGSFPAIALNDEMDHNIFYSSYVQTYLQRDLRDLTRVGDEQSFLRFLRAAAARTAQLVNYSDLARDADISVPTAKTWLSILESSGLVYLLEPYFTNVTKRLVKAPKLYFLDTGLCAYLTGWTSPETLEAGAMSGAVLETYVISELLKSYWHYGQEAPFFFYRDRDKKEIDLLIHRDGRIYPLEIKKTANPGKDAVKTFSALKKFRIPIGHGGVICLTDTTLPIIEGVDAIPINCL